MLLALFALPLAGCTSFPSVSLPSFGFGGDSSSLTPDCQVIEKRMKIAKKKYASALGREKPAVYLTFTGLLSRTMKTRHLKGVHQMSDLDLDDVVIATRERCISSKLGGSICLGANRLGRAYKPLVVAAREAHDNYCGDRPIR